jgi:hypothetical protein
MTLLLPLILIAITFYLVPKLIKFLITFGVVLILVKLFKGIFKVSLVLLAVFILFKMM